MRGEKTNPGQWIEIDGVDCAGKSTIAGMLNDYLLERGNDSKVYRSPGGTEFGESIRDVFLNGPDRPAMSDLLIIASLLAASVSHIKKRKENSNWSISDRGLLSCYGYEVGRRGLDPEQVDTALKLATTIGSQHMTPDLFILLDVSYETYRQRLGKPKNPDRWEKVAKETFTGQRTEFLRAAKQYEATVIDATRPLDKVFEDVVKAVEPILEAAANE